MHIEGYQLEGDLKEAALHAMKFASENGVKVSVDLADPALIKRNLESFKKIVAKYAEIVFVNENEAEAFTGLKDEEALHKLYEMCSVAIVKLGSDGSLIKAEDMIYKIPIVKVDVKNTNGAGDAYAAGILYSIATGKSWEEAGKIASEYSSKIVSSVGARL